MKRARHPQSGFTLVELAIVIIIIGLLAGFGLNTSLVTLENAKRKQTLDRIAAVEESLVQFVMRHQRLPCPDLVTARDGFEKRDSQTGLCAPQAGGILPWASLGISENLALDGYGRYFSYRTFSDPDYGLTRDQGMDMTACRSTAPPSAEARIQHCAGEQRNINDFLRGRGLAVANTEGELIMDPDAAYPTGAAYLLISHGLNRLGAYSRDGIYLGDPVSPLEAANAAPQPETALFIDSRETYAVGREDIYFDDLILRPTILTLTRAARLGPGDGF